ncbi:MAG: hypothetical protein IPF98_08300 [Gemmatimonadetes bacterium]|nr:hypothetical protein [Gemmatimonadota bacterium]
MDFGIARPISDAEQLTAPQFVLGTPAYMSPEQAAALPLDQRADVFSLTCVVAFMLSGCTPSTPRGSSPDLSSWPYASTWSESICSVLRAVFNASMKTGQAVGGSWRDYSETLSQLTKRPKAGRSLRVAPTESKSSHLLPRSLLESPKSKAGPGGPPGIWLRVLASSLASC